MDTKYGYISNAQISENVDDLINRVFSLLPKKEKGYPNINHEIASLIFRIKGLNEIMKQPPELFTVICLLEAAKDESDFQLYRKAVLDSCSIIHTLMQKSGD